MFSRIKILCILTLAFILTGLLADCSVFSGGGTYTIAVVDSTVYSSNKPNAAQSIYAGAKLAVDEFNSQSNGVKVKLESYGDGAKPQSAKPIADKISAGSAVAVIGHSTNDVVNAVAPVYEKSKLPFVIVNPVQAQITTNNHYAFRVNYTAEQEAVYLATYLAKIQNQTKASVIFSNDQYGKTLKEQFSDTFHGLGGTIVLSENTSQHKIEDIVNDFVVARTGDPGAVFIATDDATAKDILVQMKRKGVTYPIVGASALTRSHFIQLLNKEPEHAPYFVDGMLTINSLVFDSADRYANQFLHDYQAAYITKNSDNQITADDEVINGYNATLSVLSAIQRAHSGDAAVDRASVFAELSRMETSETGVRGITGPIYFNLLHNVARAPRFGIYQNGEIVSAMIQFDPIAAPEQMKPDELKDQVNKGRIMTVDGKYAYEANIVYAGTDIIGIQDVDIKTSTYKMDFYLWVRYRANSKDDKFLPADIVFSNAAESITPELVRPAETDGRTGITTETYRVTGLFKNQFLFYEYPYDRQKLEIQFRNKNATTSFIQYVVDRIGMKDTGGTSLREHFKDNGAYSALFGWNVQDAFAEQSVFSTTSTLGDPQNFGRNTSTEFSLINVGIDVQRASFQFIVKSLLPLLFTLILAYITFFLPLGHSERLGVGSTALLTTAFFHLNLASSLPEIGYTVAMEYFFYAAYVISALIVLLETVSIRIEKRGEETKSRKLKADLQKKRENLNMTGRIVYPIILLATMLGGIAIQFGVLHLDPNKTASNSLVDKFLNEKTQVQTIASAPSAQTNTLRLGTWRPEDTEQMQTLLKVFESKNKNINIQYEPVMGAKYDSILANQLETGNGPDLFFVHPYDTRVTQYLLPLNDLPLQDNFDANKSDPWKGSDGKYYALPYVGVVQGIYYNKDFFALHSDIPTPDTWQTWDDLIKYSQMIADAGKLPFANALNNSNDSEMFQSILVNFVGGPAGRAKYSTTDSKNACFNSYEVNNAFQAIQDIRPFILNSKFPSYETAKWTDDSISKQYFIDGKAVMLFGGSWDLQYFTDNAKFNWSVFAPPAPAGKKTYVIFQPDVGIGINSASQHKQEARAFLQWLMNDGVKATEENLPGRYLLIKSAATSIPPSTGHAGDFAKLTQFPSDIRWMFSDVDGQYPRSSELIRSALYQIVTPDSAGNYLSAKQAAQQLQTGLGEWYKPAQTCK